MQLTQDLFNIALGCAASAGIGAVLWLTARNTRTAAPGSLWAKDVVATWISLFLVSAIVIAAAWTLKGTMDIFPEPITGASIGILLSFACIFLAMRILGRLPQEQHMGEVGGKRQSGDSLSGKS